MTFFTYSRKSKYTGKGESIENQIALCKDYILSHIPGAKEDDIQAFEDEGFSGKNTSRPQFQRMMELVRQMQADYIVCYRLDRISRNVGDFSVLIEELNELKVSFICIKEQFDTSRPMGRAMMYIASVFAQLERETIAERVRDNMYMLAKSGRWLGGITPTGFCSEQEKQIELDDKIRTSFKLTPVHDELRLVKIIYDTFLATESVAGTTKFLNSRQYRTKTGKEFGVESVKSILRNPVYSAADEASKQYFLERGAQLCFTDEDCDGTQGFMPFNRSCKGKHGRVPKDITEWIIAVGKHKGTVSGANWVRVQQLLDEKRAYAKRNAPSPVSFALLSGVLRCGNCGNRMRPRIFSNYIKADGKPAFYYACATKDDPQSRTCGSKNAGGYEIEQAVCAELLTFAHPPPALYSQLQTLRDELSVTASPGTQRQGFLQARIKENGQKIQNLIAAIADGDTEPVVLACIKDQIHLLQTQQAAFALELNDIMQREIYENSCENRLIFLKASLLELSRLSETASSTEKKRIVASIVSQIIWDGESIHIYL